MNRISLPYGIDNFETVRTSNCYYIDKTGFIKELLGEAFSVNLLTRPRRFGKTLTMSLLAEFFDIRKDSRALFDGLEISEELELCRQWMNQYPVLSLTLKDVEGSRFEDAYGLLKFVISSLCIEHSYLGESDKTDEYDVPLAKAGDYNYYEEMLNIVKRFLGMVWKSNPYLQFAVVSGCLRIAKESIFTGANNFISNSISDTHYQNYFGFTEEEVRTLLEDAGFPEALLEIKRWYDGYRFGEKEIYCPWDVINHVRALMQNPGAEPENYWIDTSHNNIIRRFIELPDINVNDKFETLLSGSVIQVRIREDLTYDIADSSEENLWSILYLTGYLTQVLPEDLPDGMKMERDKKVLRIPNEEIKSVFSDTVKAWFEDKIEAEDRREFFREGMHDTVGRERVRAV